MMDDETREILVKVYEALETLRQSQLIIFAHLIEKGLLSLEEMKDRTIEDSLDTVLMAATAAKLKEEE